MTQQTNRGSIRKQADSASDYTHSVWSGKKYARPQTQAELTAESVKVLRSHPTISRAMKCDDEMMRRLFGDAFQG